MQTEQQDEVRLYMWGSAECDQFEAKDKDGEELPEVKRPYPLDFFIKNTLSIVTVACGGLHTIFLTNQGQVYSQGCDDDGILGRAETTEPRRPGLVKLPQAVNMICAGDVHSVAANSETSAVYFWGFYRNNNGAMGQKTFQPTRIGEKDFKGKIDKILSGNNHTIIFNNGKVFSCGDADTFVLGRVSNTRNKITQSLKLAALGEKNIVDVFTGGYAAFIKRERRTKQKSDQVHYEYYSWGLNNYGQLGLGHTEKSSVPTQILDFSGLNIIKIVGGEHHTLALDSDGNVYAFGRNDDGQLGVGEEINEELKQKALLQKQQDNEEKQLMQEKKKSKGNSKKSKSEKEDGKTNLMENQETDRVFGYEYLTKPMKVKSLQNIKNIMATGFYSYALDREEQAYSWGLGQNYVLGNREDESQFEPYQIQKGFFRNENLLFLSLGGQHVAALTGSTPKTQLGQVNLELLTQVPEIKTLKSLKGGKELPSQRKSSKSSSKAKEESKIQQEHDSHLSQGAIEEKAIKRNINIDQKDEHFTNQIKLL